MGSTSIIIVAIGGPSLLGKTTVAQALQKVLSTAYLVHQDDFYFPEADLPIDQATGYANWDCREAIDFAKFGKYLKDVRSTGINTLDPIVTREPPLTLNLDETDVAELEHRVSALELGKRLSRTETSILLVDGFMLLDTQELRDLFDVCIFVYADEHTLHKRRIERGAYPTDCGEWTDPPDYFETIVWPLYKRTHFQFFKNENPNDLIDENVMAEIGVVPIHSSQSSPLFLVVSTALDAILDFFK